MTGLSEERLQAENEALTTMNHTRERTIAALLLDQRRLQARIDNALALCREAQAESTDGGVTDVDTLAPSAIAAALTGQDPA